MRQLTGEFKETEIGPIPSDWAYIPFGQVATLQRGKDLPTRSRTEGDYPIIGSNGIVGFHNDYVVDGYCLTVGRSGSVGKLFLHNGRSWPLNTALWVKDFHENIPEFVYYLLQTFDFVKYSTGVSVPTLNRNYVHDVPLPLPPLDEQRRIAAVLAAIQDAIAAQEDVIAAARAFKRSLMHRLFTYGPGRVPAETKETEIGEIPSHWDVVTVDDVLNVKLGKMLSQKAKQGISPRPYMRNANVQWGYVDLNNVAEMDFSPNEQERFRLEKDDILVCEGGEVGRTAIWNNQLEECYYQKAIHRLRPKSKSTISPYYFLHYMTLIFLVRNVSVVEGARSTIAHIPVAKLKALPLALPHKSEQDQIVGAIGSIDAKIAAEEDRKAALDALFKSMLHQLMTGQIRLLEDEELLAQGL
ncbi:MAG: restriction endonuclease subunit S [Caldilineaceae bacterium]|nr:restriction endonuclease subunit S [Caldilineaceae bacterium]MBP8109481.1 restriction endonuclease subunit S [Caldilineaceae bacterium]MBP8124214.1 restriction endonuclease subunit S [Caldilineaceae bacterium]MBP9073232.1 restriction endonuclease subunit S [Caldilineaceae bacterium]